MPDTTRSPKCPSRALAPALLTAAVALAGCGGSLTTPSAPAPVPPAVLHGSVYGGQQPVSGSTIQLYAANLTGGYGSASTPLLTSTVTTTAAGGFTITGLYTCPTPSSLVYLVSAGGDPGVGSNNPNLALMTALGPCGNLSTSTFIVVNELTTIASVYPLAPFMKSLSAIGTTPANLQGLTNAFATVNNLVDTSSGKPSGPTLPANAVLPVNEINTLSNILAYCVNSPGISTTAATNCGSLFQYTTPATGPAPTDTISAALNIARSPSTNVALLLTLNPPSSPFQPALSAATDFTLSIRYKSGGLSSPSASAVDAAGNLWIANASNNTLTVLNPTGAPLPGSPFSGGGLSSPSAIAIDASGNAWIADSATSKLSVFTPSGSSTLTAATTLASPSSIAIDTQGILWIANSGNNSVTAVTPSGITALTSTPYSVAGTTAPTAIAINPF